MELVQSYHQLNSFISEIRSLRKGFISNLFLHFEKHNLLKRKNCFIKLLLKDILFLEIIQWQVICFILQQTNSN